MSDHQGDWQWYWRRGGTAPMLVLVDLSLESSLARERLPLRMDVTVGMQSPDELGVEEKTGDAGQVIEQALRELVEARGGIYAGSIATRGAWHYHYYLPHGVLEENAVERLSEVFPPYVVRSQQQEDAEWSLYESFLLPGEAEWRLIENRQRLARLGRAAGQGERRVLRHKFRFSDERSRLSLARFLSSYGYTATAGGAWVDAGHPQPFGLTLQREQELKAQELDEETLRLVELVGRYGGSYDGWET